MSEDKKNFPSITNDPAEFAELLREADRMRPAPHSPVERLAAALRKVLGEKQDAERQWREVGAELRTLRNDYEQARADLADVDVRLGSNAETRFDIIEALSWGEGAQRIRAEKAEADLAREREAHEETREDRNDYRDRMREAQEERDAARADVEEHKQMVKDERIAHDLTARLYRKVSAEAGRLRAAAEPVGKLDAEACEHMAREVVGAAIAHAGANVDAEPAEGRPCLVDANELAEACARAGNTAGPVYGIGLMALAAEVSRLGGGGR